MERLALLLTFVYVAIHPYFHFYILHFDYRFITISLLAICYLWLHYLRAIRYLFGPTALLTVAILYTVLNSLVKGHGDADYTNWFLFTDTIVVLGIYIIGFRLSRIPYSTLFWLSVFVSFVASTMFLLFEEVIHIDKINRNDYAWDMNVVSMFMLVYSVRRSHKLIAIFTATLILVVILLIESRKSYIFQSIILIYLGIDFIKSLNKGRSFRRVMNIVFSSLAFAGIFLMLNSTSLGDRFEGSIEFLDLTPDSFDGRANFYFTAPILFAINPWTGVGLRNYIVYSLNYDERLHSEILVQLLENGIVGFLLWSIFYITSIGRSSVPFKFVLIIVFLTAFLFRWNYNHYLSFMFLGLIASNEKNTYSRFQLS